MIHPILAYGHITLRRQAVDLPNDFPNIRVLVDDLYETMYAASGVGLAAPQIGKSLRVFVTDGEAFTEEDPSVANFKKVFINPIILEEYGDEWRFNEGCLSIPKIREDVVRPSYVRVEYYDVHWNLIQEEYTGIAARIIQHEFDHLEGKLFTDRISPIRRKLLEKDLKAISRGDVKIHYPMIFPHLRKTR